MVDLLKAFSRRDGEGEKITAPSVGVFMQVKASDEECNGAFFIAEEVTAPNNGPPLHIHKNATEFFYCLQGHYEFTIGSSKLAVNSGGFAVVPPGTPHTFKNIDDSPGYLLFGISPAPKVNEFFRQFAKLSASGELTPEKANELGATVGIEFIGPA